MGGGGAISREIQREVRGPRVGVEAAGRLERGRLRTGRAAGVWLGAGEVRYERLVLNNRSSRSQGAMPRRQPGKWERNPEPSHGRK